MTTTNISNLSEAKVYVGTYKKYNEGSIFGKWLDLSDYSDKEEFLQACAELHVDEVDPEFMFQDFENIPDCFISESYISDKLFDIISRIDEIDNIEAFETYLNWKGCDIENDDFDDLKSDFEDAFCGEYSSKEDYAYEVVEQCYELPEFAQTYFDYEKFARDLFMTDNYFDNGFVFYNR